jgi:3-oxoacyl-[acyl-carrier protein] reductase/pteridine reductase
MTEQLRHSRTALVTGGGRRIGRALVLALARSGFDVALTYRHSQAAAEQVVAEVESLGRRALAVVCDVRSEDSVCAAVDAVGSHFGRLDLLVNNAAVYETAKLEELTVRQWDTVFETNARGPFLVARQALPLLRQARGRIVNIGSLGGIRPWATHGHYCASKAALHMLTQTMARGFAPEVSVNCVAPGFIDVEESESAESRHFAAKTPLQRNGTADDIAQAVLFFATGPAFITGQILAVDGGL